MTHESIRRDSARREYLENNRQPEYREPRCTDGAPETHCGICSEELPGPDAECPDPECAAWREAS